MNVTIEVVVGNPESTHSVEVPVETAASATLRSCMDKTEAEGTVARGLVRVRVLGLWFGDGRYIADKVEVVGR